MWDYYTLRDYADNGTKLGTWKGKSVFACAKADLNYRGNGAFYVVYDDDNKLIGKLNDEWYEYGTVDKHGSVSERSLPKLYGARRTPASKSSGKTKKEEQRDKPIGDVKAELDVEDVLKKAREMTVEDLLKGFNYGL